MLLLLAMLTPGMTDAELVDRFKRGDREAYTTLVRRYQDRVYGLAYRWMHDDQLAREVAQDVFLSLYRSLDGFRGDARLSTWIHRVVVNQCKNRRQYRRRRHADRHEPLEGTRDADDAPVRQFAADGPGPDAGVHQREATALVREALEALDPDQREILLLRDLQDLDYEEIAEILGIARGTVKSRLHRARASLARVLSRRVDLQDVI